MTLPYDIARCAGAREHSGNRPQQCVHCARQLHNTPEHCHPYYQPWMEPPRAAATNSCPYYIATQPTQTNP